LAGPWQVWASLALPDNRVNEKTLHEAVSILQDAGVEVDLIEVSSVGVSQSFYHYNTSRHQWNIPWLAMKGWGKRIEEESLDSLIDRIDVPANRTDVYLDKQDIEILALVSQRVYTTRILREELGIGQNKLLKKLRKLKSRGLLTKKWSVVNIGLTERIALRVSNAKYSNFVDAWSRELPKVYIHYCGRKDQLITLDLPIGNSFRLLNTLRELQWNVEALPLTRGVYGDWTFPYELWDVENQGWNAPQEKIDEWLESLLITPRKLLVDFPESSNEQMLTHV
jgi:hypothetical protein